MADNANPNPRNLLKEMREFFDTPTRPMGAKEFTREYKELSPEDKAALKNGIEDGTLNY